MFIMFSITLYIISIYCTLFLALTTVYHPHLMMQNKLMLALYTEKSINTALVARSSHRLS